MPTLVFSGANAKINYEICYYSIVLTDQVVQLADWDTVVDLLKKLKSIGVPATDKINGVEVYSLAPSEESAIHSGFTIERAEIRRLIEFVERPIWRTNKLEEVVAVRKWLKELADAK